MRWFRVKCDLFRSLNTKMHQFVNHVVPYFTWIVVSFFNVLLFVCFGSLYHHRLPSLSLYVHYAWFFPFEHLLLSWTTEFLDLSNRNQRPFCFSSTLNYSRFIDWSLKIGAVGWWAAITPLIDKWSLLFALLRPLPTTQLK